MRRVNHLCPDDHEAGKTNSPVCEQYQSGKLFSETEFLLEKPHGRTRQWTETGTLILDANNKHGIKDRQYQSWWDDGTPKERGVFVDGTRQPGYCWFDPSGSLWKQL